jgi:hypothetical protein
LERLALLPQCRDLAEVEGRLADEIDRQGYDLVLVSTMRAALAPSIARYLRTPSVYYCHEPPRRFYEPWCRPEAAPLSAYERLRLRLHWPTIKAIEAHARRNDVASVRSATMVLTNSNYSAGRIRQVYQRSAAVSYLGVDSNLFHPGGPTCTWPFTQRRDP